MLSQGEQRDAEFRHNGIVIGRAAVVRQSCKIRFLWHSTGFMYRPTSATVQMLKLHPSWIV